MLVRLAHLYVRNPDETVTALITSGSIVHCSDNFDKFNRLVVIILSLLYSMNDRCMRPELKLPPRLKSRYVSKFPSVLCVSPFCRAPVTDVANIVTVQITLIILLYYSFICEFVRCNLK